MARLGHSSVRAATIYQHATLDQGKTADQQEIKRADDGNRTRMTSLEGFGRLSADGV
jgi:hypothetical protein